MMDFIGTIRASVKANPEKLTLKVKITNADGEKPDGVDRLVAMMLLAKMHEAVNDAAKGLGADLGSGGLRCETKLKD